MENSRTIGEAFSFFFSPFPSPLSVTYFNVRICLSRPRYTVFFAPFLLNCEKHSNRFIYWAHFAVYASVKDLFFFFTDFSYVYRVAQWRTWSTALLFKGFSEFTSISSSKKAEEMKIRTLEKCLPRIIKRKRKICREKKKHHRPE